jgi:hypothetical protein
MGPGSVDCVLVHHFGKVEWHVSALLGVYINHLKISLALFYKIFSYSNDDF